MEKYLKINFSGFIWAIMKLKKRNQMKFLGTSVIMNEQFKLQSSSLDHHASCSLLPGAQYAQ